MEPSPQASRTDILRASPPMFENRLLDRLSRVHPATPLFIYIPVITVLVGAVVGRMPTWGIAAALVVGYFVWTLAEYWLHRVIFHFEPEAGIGARLHWIIHGVHHDHPNDPLRLVMPPSVSVPLSSLFCLAFWAVLGTPHWYALGA